ncbi:MAG: 2-amino-4-hydroxy-6-hydroxymethyldihydropteridine diphosphokinase [Omnitrophica bacterium GWA2_52_8]|nr:MAG: 2-amino-4-hydroxy-6-hydroxymethyldihydropteridine diphosphokinase [Omnitrophica bacterium GWA2_52_8]
MRVPVYLSAGSNLGDRSGYLAKARECLIRNSRIHWGRSSPVYETLPVGGPPQGLYLNAVWEIGTEMQPDELLGCLDAIERELGRTREVKNEPRTIDLDILFFGDRVYETESLTIPHPRLTQRYFVLKPLADLAADYCHPVFNKSIAELLDDVIAHSATA